MSRGVLDNQLWRIGQLSPLWAAGRRGGGNQSLMLFHTLDALKVEKTWPVSQSVCKNTAQNESICMRRGCGAGEHAAVWIQFKSVAATPSPTSLSRVERFSTFCVFACALLWVFYRTNRRVSYVLTCGP